MNKMFARLVYSTCIVLWIVTLTSFLITGHINRFDIIVSIMMAILFFAGALIDTFKNTK